MIITCFGASEFCEAKKYRPIVMKFLEEKIGENAATFYIGCIGKFDWFMYFCATDYRATHKNVSVIYVSPYHNAKYIANKTEDMKFDDVICPFFENTPQRFLILKRNRWMVDQSDLIITFTQKIITRASRTVEYAVRKNKEIIDVSSL